MPNADVFVNTTRVHVIRIWEQYAVVKTKNIISIMIDYYHFQETLTQGYSAEKWFTASIAYRL
jgi:phosphoglycerate dehydrogenase-like enzyme